MFDQSTRSIWLNDQLWPKIRDTFGFSSLPAHGLFTVGYPSSGARGRSDKIRPAEINYQWTGNPNEPFAVFIHPVYFDKPENIVKAIAFAAAKATRGARWGAFKVGLEKENDGTIIATPEAQVKIDEVLRDVGDPPAGYGMAFPVRRVQRTRLRKYVCASSISPLYPVTCVNHPIIRAASDTLQVQCKHCGEMYKLA
jgi:hypothetical protein